MADDPWPRTCDGCGETYDARDRGVRGPFHFRIVGVDADDEGRHHLVGHWRAGIWREGLDLELRGKDGYRVTLVQATMDAPVSVKAGERGRAVIHVRALKPADVQRSGCVWGRE